MRKDITGIILCGGKSSRMQTNKALLELGDKSVIEFVINKMKSVFSELILSANAIDDYSFLKLPIIQDAYLSKGPLGGIHAALKYSKTEKNFIIGCDMPLITAELINYLININSDKAILLPKANGRTQQLCGIYSKSIISEIENIFNLSEMDKSIKGSVHELIGMVPTEFIDVEHLPFYNENMFLNMNSPAEYELIKNIYGNQ